MSLNNSHYNDYNNVIISKIIVWDIFILNYPSKQ